jgi:Fic family protein
MEMDGQMEALNTSTARITPEILSLIAEIDEFKGAWRAIGRIAPERLSGLRRVATSESVGSSKRIEGARLTDREVEKLLANIRLGSFTTRDEQEVAGYAEVMEIIFSAYEAISFTENHIRQLHRDLLAHSIKDERHRGAYKTLSNNVEAFDEQCDSLGIVFETASPFDTPRRMDELIAWLDEQGREKRLHPLLVIAVFVVVFLEIHPFQDGNGRLSRILTTLLLLRAGYAYPRSPSALVPSRWECKHVKTRPFITPFSEQNLETLRAAHRASRVETHVKQRRSVPRQTHLSSQGTTPPERSH